MPSNTPDQYELRRRLLAAGAGLLTGLAGVLRGLALSDGTER